MHPFSLVLTKHYVRKYSVKIQQLKSNKWTTIHTHTHTQKACSPRLNNYCIPKLYTELQAQKHVQQSASGTQYKHKTLAKDLASVVYVYTRMPKPSKLRKNNDVTFPPEIWYILEKFRYAGSTDGFAVVYRKIWYGWQVCVQREIFAGVANFRYFRD